jgi:hypothetical protein
VLEQAIAVLPRRQRELMTLLTAQPDADYEHIGDTLQMPQGSIEPTGQAVFGASGAYPKFAGTTTSVAHEVSPDASRKLTPVCRTRRVAKWASALSVSRSAAGTAC